jgi:predicted metal-dependent phosphoesterase TrpH
MMIPAIGQFDLHMHSNVSDGTLSPTELVQRISKTDVKVMALTDHDTLGGLAEAKTEADRHGIQFINGVELTCDWRGRVIHLVGLGFDPSSDKFEAYMDHLVQLRYQRAEKIAERLEKRGVARGLFDLAKQYAGEGQIGRPHFAQALLELGKVESMQEAFDKYLGQGCAGDVKAEWPAIEQSIALIKEAGGVAILAHPTKYKMTFTKLRELMADMLSAGADGLEVSYPGVTPGHQHELIKLADRAGCWVSAGSDFHSPDQRWTALGRYPHFDAQRVIVEQLCA